MKTDYLPADEAASIKRAAALLREGKLVVFPTDTLYGVAAAVDQEAAIARLYDVKGRAADKGIPVLLADTVHLAQVARAIPPLAQRLVAAFWPGPLTLIVPRRHDLPTNLSPNDNLAVRIPDDKIARAVIRAAGGALAVTSANLSGQPPARDAGEALAALGGLVAAVVDGGPAPHGVPSTIVDCTCTPPRLLREGPLRAHDLQLPA